MRWPLELFLIATTTAAMAQSPGQSADRSNLPDAPSQLVRRAVVDGATQSPASVTSFNVAGSNASSLPPPSKRYLNFGTSTSAAFAPLTFIGGNTASDAGERQAVGGSGTNCGSNPANKSTGSDWINSVLAITSHKGGRYCALGEGGFWKRGTYAATRAFVAHRYDGGGSFNASELLGPATSSAMPGSYYAYPNYTGQRLAARYASTVGRDTLKNMFSEFWPDFASHILRRHP